ncbi:RNA-binding protein musashi/mRNA cleavage and polyadenylation factor I complex subunit HRP1 protein [Dioscorea alata]|uniref:RNA-binding protein musashi/mRNA cleavage and polyadenylation factor I complex subunit HRP1 protein n=2 Tax=Dioscorea alata TaxID=55571 RepID=A0ACB7UJB9_DIOAL|nr:RNA-binding protein musashi/mRNA cleavage and polyadenylation factor I complex subunit HRP1 protein [Dioscorea alata]KAH7660563.1 RNA-binding protein musashi/mRNA cleavage and polyadenylation factor I complex subunit HRP1 protein [Dioscorea alata]
MESDHGKLFIGGISWDTNEERLRDYFTKFGEVMEAVIMKDRITGRARGFGFIVYADPAVAERVVMEKHMIDGRLVEAKKAIPRDDQNILGRQNNIVHGSPGPARTKKIFVGGLPSSITGDDFKMYFLQFGPISDVVVMYDHSTQRPRGFGFITFESEDSVDKALFNTFHELNGKMVEVKRAVPRELSPVPATRSPFSGYSYGGMHRINSFINGFPQGFNPTSLASYGMKVDSRFNPPVGERNAYPSYGAGYGMGMNFAPGFNSSFLGNSNYNNNVGYGGDPGIYYSGGSSRYGNGVGYGGGNLGTGIGMMARNVWGNDDLNYNTMSAGSNTYMTTGGVELGNFDNASLTWGGSSTTARSVHHVGSNVSYAGADLHFATADNGIGLNGNGFGRSSGTGIGGRHSNSLNGENAGIYGSSSVYGDPTWRSGSNDLDGDAPFGYELGSAAPVVTAKGALGYASGYNVNNRQQNRGVAA